MTKTGWKVVRVADGALIRCTIQTFCGISVVIQPLLLRFEFCGDRFGAGLPMNETIKEAMLCRLTAADVLNSRVVVYCVAGQYCGKGLKSSWRVPSGFRPGW